MKAENTEKEFPCETLQKPGSSRRRAWATQAFGCRVCVTEQGSLQRPRNVPPSTGQFQGEVRGLRPAPVCRRAAEAAVWGSLYMTVSSLPPVPPLPVSEYAVSQNLSVLQIDASRHQQGQRTIPRTKRRAATHPHPPGQAALTQHPGRLLHRGWGECVTNISGERPALSGSEIQTAIRNLPPRGPGASGPVRSRRAR